MTRNERFVLLVLVLAVLSGCSWFLPSYGAQLDIASDSSLPLSRPVAVDVDANTETQVLLEVDEQYTKTVLVPMNEPVTISARYSSSNDTPVELRFTPTLSVPGVYIIRVREPNNVLTLVCISPGRNTPGCDDVQNENP